MQKLLKVISFTIAGMLASTSVMAAVSSIAVPKSLTTTKDTALTITAGGTFQAGLAANPARKNCTITNTHATDNMFVFFGTAAAANSATTGAGIPVVHGASFNCATAGVGVVTDAIAVTMDTTSDVALVIEQQ